MSELHPQPRMQSSSPINSTVSGLLPPLKNYQEISSPPKKQVHKLTELQKKSNGTFHSGFYNENIWERPTSESSSEYVSRALKTWAYQRKVVNLYNPMMWLSLCRLDDETATYFKIIIRKLINNKLMLVADLRVMGWYDVFIVFLIMKCV